MRQLAPLLTFFLLFGSTRAAATGRPPVSIELAIANSPTAASLRLTLQSHFRNYPSAKVEVSSSTDFLAIDTQPPFTSINTQAPRDVTLIGTVGGAPLGMINVRVSNANVFVVERTYYASNDAGTIRLLTSAEYARALKTASAAAYSGEADAKASAHLQHVLANGYGPVTSAYLYSQPGSQDLPGRAAPDTEIQRAWDRTVTNMRSSRAALLSGECGPARPTFNNQVFITEGQITYSSGGFSSNLSNGYPVEVITEIEVTNDCHEIGYITRAYGGDSTDSNGFFEISALTDVDPISGTNPLIALEVIPPDVGVCIDPLHGGSVNTQSLSLFDVNVPYSSWYTYNGQYYYGTHQSLIGEFDTAASPPWPFLLRWNEAIKEGQQMWADRMLPSNLTAFKAAYDPTDPGTVYYAYFDRAHTERVILTQASETASRFVMAHEFGHDLQFLLQNHQLVGTDAGHQRCLRLDDATGFIEGFADWHGEFATDSPFSPLGPRFGGVDDYGFTCTNDADAECHSSCDSSYGIEGNVAAFFWDLFDIENHDTFDKTRHGIGKVRPVDFVTFEPAALLLSWESYASFPAFYDDFTTRGIWGAEAAHVDLLRNVDGVDVP